MTKPLKTLAEHNAARRRAYNWSLDPVNLNGIECPQCGQELHDVGNKLMSWPPQKHIACNCGYKGLRIA